MAESESEFLFLTQNSDWDFGESLYQYYRHAVLNAAPEGGLQSPGARAQGRLVGFCLFVVFASSSRPYQFGISKLLYCNKSNLPEYVFTITFNTTFTTSFITTFTFLLLLLLPFLLLLPLLFCFYYFFCFYSFFFTFALFYFF